jgi:hypothetical protein
MPFVYSVRGTHNSPKEVSLESPSKYLKITGGDKIYTAGGYVIHCFLKTGDSELRIDPITQNLPATTAGLIANSLEMEYLVVGGGGAGGSRHGGGGGAGAYTTGIINMALGPNAVTVAAGAPINPGDSTGGTGGSSQLTPRIIAGGGGGGGSWAPGGTVPSAGASGGGAAGSNNVGGGTTAPSAFITADGYWGNPGGRSTPWDNPIGLLRVGGGGGAGESGENAEIIGPNGAGRNQRGGDGKVNSITGTSYYWAGGGGGASWNERGGQGGRGGAGGGAGNPVGVAGEGGINAGQNSQAGTGTPDIAGGQAGANTGSGGGGGQQVPSTGGAGGPGIVVVRYRR